MHESGVIYRDNRLVNWSVKLRTAVSDIEVDYIDIPKRTFLDVPGEANGGAEVDALQFMI